MNLNMGRYMGLDYGSKTVGVAVSDELNLMAHPLTTIFRQRELKLRKTIAELRDIIIQNNISIIVLGLPLTADGGVGSRAEKTLIFRDLLRSKFNIDIILVDERLSTVESNEILLRCGIGLSERKKYLDSVAATVILQEYMDNIEFYDKKRSLYE